MLISYDIAACLPFLTTSYFRPDIAVIREHFTSFIVLPDHEELIMDDVFDTYFPEPSVRLMGNTFQYVRAGAWLPVTDSVNFSFGAAWANRATILFFKSESDAVIASLTITRYDGS